MTTNPTRLIPPVLAGLDVPLNPPVTAGEVVVRHQQRPRVVDAVIVPAHPSRRRPRWRGVRPWLTALAGLAVAAAFAGLVWLLVKAVLALVGEVLVLVALVAAWVAAYWVRLLLAGGLLLFLLGRVGGRSSCAGLHCGGCRR